ncbi:MAG: cupin domain-containing protein [Rubellimicrobium sp.]|nr:cupin domain-containing protein [Rubellimicrobium sp.]
MTQRPSRASGADNDPGLGPRLRARRTALGLTMQQVADRAGLTIGFISQSERGLASPSLGSLTNVARVLDMDPATLFTQPPSQGEVTTAGTRPVYGIDPSNMSYERISAAFPGHTLRAVLIHEAPGHRSEPIRHEGEELFYILQGALTVEIEGQRHVLAAGDSIHFASTRVHSSWNHTDTHTSILHVCTMDVFGDGTRPRHSDDTTGHHEDRTE